MKPSRWLVHLGLDLDRLGESEDYSLISDIYQPMGDRACYREFCPECDGPVSIADEECPDCGRALDIE